MFTCFLKYTINPDKVEEFKRYAEIWVELIEEHGGIHHGYFLPNDELDDKLNKNFSFPKIAKVGEKNMAIALFSFPDLDAYEKYKKSVKNDPLCKKATELFNSSKCFLNYERNFFDRLS